MSSSFDSAFTTSLVKDDWKDFRSDFNPVPLRMPILADVSWTFSNFCKISSVKYFRLYQFTLLLWIYVPLSCYIHLTLDNDSNILSPNSESKLSSNLTTSMWLHKASKLNSFNEGIELNIYINCSWAFIITSRLWLTS